jgi:hypothetical protein
MSPANREAAMVYASLSRQPNGNTARNPTGNHCNQDLNLAPGVFPSQPSSNISDFQFGQAFKVSFFFKKN